MDESPFTTTPEIAPGGSSVHPARLVVFAVMSAGFLLWVAFGQVEARVWVSGQLSMIDRRISAMWQYFGNNLPDLPFSTGITFLYWFSILFLVIGTIAGLWLFLGTSDDVPGEDSLGVVQAAHTQHESE